MSISPTRFWLSSKFLKSKRFMFLWLVWKWRIQQSTLNINSYSCFLLAQGGPLLRWTNKPFGMESPVMWHVTQVLNESPNRYLCWSATFLVLLQVFVWSTPPASVNKNERVTHTRPGPQLCRINQITPFVFILKK